MKNHNHKKKISSPTNPGVDSQFHALIETIAPPPFGPLLAEWLRLVADRSEFTTEAEEIEILTLLDKFFDALGDCDMNPHLAIAAAGDLMASCILALDDVSFSEVRDALRKEFAKKA